MESDRIFAVSVLEGSHAGAVLPLPAGKYRFGRSRDADVVLTDEGLAPMHFAIDLAKHGASVASMGGAVTLDGCGAASSKSSARLHFPFEVALDGVRLRVEGPEIKSWPQVALEWYEHCEAWVRQPRRAPVLAAIALIPIAIYGIGAAATGAPDPAAAQASAASAVRTPMPIAKAVETLRGRAEQAGLLGQLEIARAGDAIAVRGALMPDQMAIWQRVRQDFDSAYGTGYAFDSQINTVNSMERPHLDLQAISVGARPYVITSSGERLAEGDRLTSGWTITKIERRQVILTQGDQRMALTY